MFPHWIFNVTKALSRRNPSLISKHPHNRIRSSNNLFEVQRYKQICSINLQRRRIQFTYKHFFITSNHKKILIMYIQCACSRSVDGYTSVRCVGYIVECPFKYSCLKVLKGIWNNYLLHMSIFYRHVSKISIYLQRAL